MKKMRNLLFVLFLLMSSTILAQPPAGTANTNNDPPGESACTATPICNLDGYNGTTLGSYTVDAWQALKDAICAATQTIFDCMSIENDSYLEFTAGASTISFDLYVYSCQKPVTTKAIQVAFFSAADCGSGSVTVVYANSKIMQNTTATPESITVTGLTPGQTYYILIDGYSGQICDYTFVATSGVSTGVMSNLGATGADTTICKGSFINVSATGGSGSYSWSGDAGLGDTTGTTVTITPPNTGTYSYHIESDGQTQSGGISCPSSASYDFNVIVNAPQTPTFDQVGPFCPGQTFSLPTTSNEGIQGTWSPAPNTTATTTYTFTPSSTSACAETTQMTVEISTNNVTPTFTNPGPICAGSTVNPLPTTSNNGIQGTWSPATIDNTQDGIYTFTPSSGSCATTTTMSISVTQKTTPTFTNPGPICIGATFTLPTSSTEGITGSWTSAPNANVTTTYTFTPDANQCADTAMMQVVVTTEITPSFNPVGPICEGQTFSLPTTSNNGVTGTWSPAPNTDATTTYTFTPTNTPNGCTATPTTMNVSVTPNPIVDFSASPMNGVAPLEVTFTNQSTNANGYAWNFGNGQTSNAVTPPAVTYSDSGDYTVVLTASNGNCSDTSSIVIHVENAPSVHILAPNVFSPNGDGANDEYFIKTQFAEDMEVPIFDRWGMLITTLQGLNAKWNGKIGNQLASTGVYLYKYKVTDLAGKIHEGHGFFLLVK